MLAERWTKLTMNNLITPTLEAGNLTRRNDESRNIFYAIEAARVRALRRGDVFRARAFAEILERHKHRRPCQ